MNRFATFLRTAILFTCAITCCAALSAQTVIPQIADGGAWQTTLVLTNTSSAAATVSIAFFQETSNGATAAWTPPFTDAATTQNINVPAGGTVLLHTAGTAANLTVGWAQITGSAAIQAYAIFAQSVSPRPNQDGTGVAAAPSSGFLVPYDNTGGFVTAVAIANAGSSAVTINVGLQNTGASPISPAPAAITLPAHGHTTFTMTGQFSQTNNKSGTMELSTTGGSISVLAFRFDPTGSFTTAPVYPESGSPILGTGGGGGGGGSNVSNGVGGGTTPACVAGQAGPAVASFNGIAIAAAGSSLTNLSITSGVPGIPGPLLTQVSGTLGNGTNFSATFDNVTVNGNSLVFAGFAPASSNVTNASGSGSLSAGTISMTLVPGTPSTQGSACGSVSFTGIVGTGSAQSTVSINSSFSGTYATH